MSVSSACIIRGKTQKSEQRKPASVFWWRWSIHNPYCCVVLFLSKSSAFLISCMFPGLWILNSVCLPGLRPVAYGTESPHLQWRDRTGISPVSILVFRYGCCIFFSLQKCRHYPCSRFEKNTKRKIWIFTGENSVFSSIEIDYILTGNLSNVITGICGNNIREKFQ